MITIITLSKQETLPQLIAYEQEVYQFNFTGDLTYTDDQAVVWNWVGVQAEAPNIQAIRVGASFLLEVFSLQDCIDTKASFFYTQGTGKLYVHWQNGSGDWAVGREIVSIEQSTNFFANNIDRVAKGYYDNTLYEPKLINLTGLSFQVDPLKFGLVSQTRSTASITNQNGSFDNESLTSAKGAVSEIFINDSNVTTLANANQVFKGFTDSLNYNQNDINFDIIEQRFFLNGPVCPNVYVETVGLEDKFVGAPKPVAFGDIRRGICIPLDSDGVGKGDAATITFQVADPAISSIRAITALYDSNGNSVTLGTINLTNCTVQYSKAAGEDIDLDMFSWEGEGYDLGDLTYNNGLDIMRFGFEQFGNTAYLSSTFDISMWDAATATNTQPVGLSIQSTRGFTEEIIEPITVSLQGIVLTKGTGLITFLERDVLAGIERRFTYDELLVPPVVDYDTSAFVSSVVVEYSRDFVNDTGILEENTTFQSEVIQEFGLDTREPISPVKTVLANRSDALSLGAEIMDTSKQPDRLVTFSIKMKLDNMDLLPFQLIGVDIGRFGEPDNKKIEILQINPNYNDYTTEYQGRIIEDIGEASNLVFSTDGAPDNNAIFNVEDNWIVETIN